MVPYLFHVSTLHLDEAGRCGAGVSPGGTVNLGRVKVAVVLQHFNGGLKYS